MSKKILVVEDNADSREVFVTLLEMEGFKVITAENGQEGLDRAASEHPALIITDVNMPVLDGVGMIETLRRNKSLAHLPIIVLTAYGDKTAGRAIQAGANRALTKPVEFTLLMNHISELLGK